MKNIERMLLDRNDGDLKAASKEAETMQYEELRAWLSDARTYVKGWWRTVTTSNSAHPASEGLNGQAHLKKRPRTAEDGIEEGPARKERKIRPNSAGFATDSAEAEATHVTIARRYESPRAIPNHADFEKRKQLPPKTRYDSLGVPTTEQELSRSVTDIIKVAWATTTEELRRCRCRVCTRQAMREQEEEARHQAEKAVEQERTRTKQEELIKFKMLLTTRLDAIHPGFPETNDDDDNDIAEDPLNETYPIYDIDSGDESFSDWSEDKSCDDA